MARVELPDNETQTPEETGPHTDRNPGTVVQSGARPTSSTPPPASSDTLLSLPTPASREDLAFDERLSAAEASIDELTRRVKALERRDASAPVSERGRWAWLVFLAVIALAWQVFSYFR